MAPHLSATRLANHLACRHLTQLDRAVDEGGLPRPEWRDPTLALLAERGLAHEAAYVRHLGRDHVVRDLRDAATGDTAATLEAMRAGAGAVVQAPLAWDGWAGRADVLLRVGDRYEVVDTKLAQQTRGATVLQLCLYTHLLAELQGSRPEYMHVVKPGTVFALETYRVEDYDAYYRLVRLRLEEAMAAPPATDTYPYPIEHCGICRWRTTCDQRRHRDDHLSLIAGVGSLHVLELERQGLRTLEQYAAEPRPLRERPARGSEAAYARAHGQARVQLRGRRARAPVHELLPPEAGRGLARLPQPSAGDVFFDIESDPFAGDGGMEYLLGWAILEDGASRYTARWALDRAAEKTAFEALMDFLMARWDRHPGMHVYHYAPYEPAAVKRLAGRHGTRERELDRLLRGERFVDLHAVARQGLRLAGERYTLTDREVFHGLRRAVALPEAGAALRRVSAALERFHQEGIEASDRAAVEGYNRDDCLSTAGLRLWLEERRAELAATGAPPERPVHGTGEASEKLEEETNATLDLFRRLTDGLGEDRAAWTEGDRARWLLAHQLDYFRRELNCAFWEHYRIRELDPEELLEERKAVYGLVHQGVIGGGPGKPVHRFTYPAQEAAVDPGDRLLDLQGAVLGRVADLDSSTRTLDIEREDGGVGHPVAVMVDEIVRPRPIDTSHHELARSVALHGVDGAGPYRAARDLLLRLPPRGAGGGPLRGAGEETLEASLRLVRALEGGVLPIQGPPGTGKTYTGARMILALTQAGKRVGVTAVGHKVILKLLHEVGVAAHEAGVTVEMAHKVSRPSVSPPQGVTEHAKNPAALAAARAGVIVGGTAWLWSSKEAVGALDYLFVDEAGQMALAPVLAAARSASNIVLLGDPQQLEQPQRGAHPEGAEVAALVHVLAGDRTIRDDAGLFLDTTWRMHPEICAFTSRLFYEGRLRSRPGLEKQCLSGVHTPALPPRGLAYVPVEHRGNQASSAEETAAVARIVHALLGPGVSWTDRHGGIRDLGPQDILVVAPYNAQVGLLRAALPPGVAVGTVDKFQGQEAPVVIYSMASSSAADAPRGMSFLYSPNRLNVATSRARALCVLVASPRVLEPDCATPDEMRWANGLCTYREMATEVRL